jgi:mono/diheme cytochrome c family protein
VPLLLLLAFATCSREDMFVQDRAVPWGRFSLFPNQMTMQHPVPGTVARKAPDTAVPQPRRVSAEMVAHGREVFDINCAPCHGRSGDGHGMIVERGFPRPPSLFSEELRRADAEHIYDVITHGKGVMFSYADRVPPADRWAVIAYVRALQLTQSTPVAMLSDADKAHLQPETGR